MNQLSEEQQKGVKEIERWLMLRTSAHSDPYADLSRALGYIRFLIPLLDSDSQAAEASAKLNATTAAIEWERDRTSERKGLNPADFDALVAKFTALSNNAATAMRDKCVEKVKEVAKGWDRAADEAYASRDLSAEVRLRTKRDAANELVAKLSSLVLDQVKRGEM